MTRVPVSSSALRSIGYDADMQQLEVEFAPDRSGKTVVWRYSDVSPDLHDRIMNAPSIGSAFHQIIRAGAFSAVRVDEKETA